MLSAQWQFPHLIHQHLYNVDIGLSPSVQININYHGICTSIILRSVRIAYCSLVSTLNKHAPIRKGFIVELTIGMPTWDSNSPPRRHLDLDPISRWHGIGQDILVVWPRWRRKEFDRALGRKALLRFWFSRIIFLFRSRHFREKRLFTSVARDLAPLSRRFSERINFTLENERSLAWASPSSQFDVLVLAPSLIHRFPGPSLLWSIKVTILNCSTSFSTRFLNFLDHSVYSWRPDLSLSYSAYVHYRHQWRCQ